MKHVRLKFALILLLAALAGFLAYPKESQLLQKIGIKNADLGVKQGLDLRGGAQLSFKADLSKVPREEQGNALNSLIQVIQRRANFAGTSEINVQRQGGDRVLVQLPGINDPKEAIDRIGKTANLQFLVQNSPQEVPQSAGLSGKDVDQASADFNPQTGQPVVRLDLKAGEATKKFGDLTTRISQTGGFLTIQLDEQVLFGPATAQPITDGRAELSGNFKIQEAREISDLVNSGALPVPVQLVEQRTIGPSLGAESVRASIAAAVIGLGFVALFMLLYYRFAGLLAVSALVIYTALSIALYKLSNFLPGYTIVLTLAGIAGFILSIGMAVDANILIFERMKEELRAGRSYLASVETAFERAWPSIRDSNASTLLTCLILYLSSAATPIIRGFAVTLALGVLLSMFTAVVVTRTFLRLLARNRFLHHPGRLVGLPSAKEQTS